VEETNAKNYYGDWLTLELATRELCPLHGTLSIFDPLFRRAATVVKPDNIFGIFPDVRDD